MTIKEMDDRLSKQWQWCDTHPDHPLFWERENVLIALLRQYEQACDEGNGK